MIMMQPLGLDGVHHLTAITANGKANHAFYTQVLGLRLVKKTVNQDDVSAYHLFYADAEGSPGSDITFFVWPAAPERRGTRSVTRTGFRVGNETTLAWWQRRLSDAGIIQSAIVARAGRSTLDFEDPEGQRLSLVADESGPAGRPWGQSPVPPEHQIIGLGPITLSVPRLEPTAEILTCVMHMTPIVDATATSNGAPRLHRFRMRGEGLGQELHVLVEPDQSPARQGAGGVHHVAFRTADVDYARWAQHLDEAGIRSSGPIDRFYFRSLYFREPGGILFEIATDGPGFAVDEAKESMGRRLALPPFLEPRRTEIEAGLDPL
jgi:glyoxalase family protein